MQRQSIITAKARGEENSFEDFISLLDRKRFYSSLAMYEITTENLLGE